MPNLKTLAIFILCSVAFLVASSPTLAPAAEPDRQALEYFETHIRPALVEHCYACHSAQAAADGKLRGGLYLDTRDGAQKGGESGPAVVPGDIDESLLISALRHDAFEMPPKGKLQDAMIDRFVKWIEMGAPDPREGAASTSKNKIDLAAARRFWSFQPLRQVEPPELKFAPGALTPVDQFLIAKQTRMAIRTNPIAPARNLVRRAWFDLLGLPPTPVEMETWVEVLTTGTVENGMSIDQEVYGQMIDRLLASNHHGERWARHWMDVARFAESHGYEQDYDRPHAYHYRDFLIKAFNADMPYDQFVRWQLAGDELAPDDPLAMMATGFLGAGAFPTQLTEAEFERARYDELDDMVATTGVAFLGLSIGCARCHDHKFDPITSNDYYRLAATFTTTIRSEIELELDPQANATVKEEHGAKPKLTKVMVTSEGLPHMKHHADGRGFPHFYPETHFLRRGDVHQKGDVATPGFLPVLMSEGYDEANWQTAPPEGWTRTSFRRAALADWITDVDHGAGHLAARVIVNRLWQHHFGRGLVATPNDFGASGERTEHEDLLDWLAAELIAQDWRLKPIHRLIMTSRVYMQSCEFDNDGAAKDPDNMYLARREPRRLEAEAIRDAMLAVSGQLDTTTYGPGTLDANMRRRGVYFFIKRSQLIPTMMLFDWPEHLVSIGQRASTTIAPQALMFMNSPQGRQYADAFAGRLSDLPDDEAVRQAYARAFGREPHEREIALASEFLRQQSAAHKAAGHANVEHLARTDYCQILMSMNEFVYVD